MMPDSIVSAIEFGLLKDKVVGENSRVVAERIEGYLRRCGYEIVDRESLKGMRQAVESRQNMALIGKMIEGARSGDVITGWPPLLSPPSGWRKETWYQLGSPSGQLPGEIAEAGEPQLMAKIVKD